MRENKMRQPLITSIAWRNPHLGRFVLDVLRETSINELIAKANYTFNLIDKTKDDYLVSIRYGKAFISYCIEQNILIITGFYLQNYDYDDDNHPIFITGSTSSDIGKINHLINNGIRI